jgi:hypothetical protein
LAQRDDWANRLIRFLLEILESMFDWWIRPLELHRSGTRGSRLVQMFEGGGGSKNNERLGDTGDNPFGLGPVSWATGRWDTLRSVVE